MQIWVSAEFLRFHGYWDSRSGRLAKKEVSRPLVLLNHAEEIVQHSESQAYLADAIININRAVDLRLAQIEKIYSIRKMTHLSPLKEWDRLEKLGIIRKTFISELNRIRNHIEHRDAKPPGKKAVLTYIDFCWYFIKSTNSICASSIDAIIFENYLDQASVYLQPVIGKTWRFELSGNLPEKSVAYVETEGFIRLARAKIEKGFDKEAKRLAVLEKAKENNQSVVFLGHDEPYNTNHLYWRGVPELSQTQTVDVLRRYFEID
jgi:hypothetical protein